MRILSDSLFEFKLEMIILQNSFSKLRTYSAEMINKLFRSLDKTSITSTAKSKKNRQTDKTAVGLQKLKVRHLLHIRAFQVRSDTTMAAF